MIAASTTLKNIYKDDVSIKIGSKCVAEYNMNMMIDGITVSSSIADTEYTSQLSYTTKDADGKDITILWPSNKANPFKKLFPVDAVAKPFRPTSSGINYMVSGPLPYADSSKGSGYLSPKNQVYPVEKPRLYYPGVTTSYKYWMAPKNANADLTVRYYQTPETWAAAKTAKLIPDTSGDIPIGNKAALTNKIVVRFDKFHGLPSACVVKIEKNDGTFLNVTYTIPTGWDGGIELFYNGSTFTQTEQSTYIDPILVKSINVSATKAANAPDNRISIIEISSRWIKEISEDMIELIEISKQTSASSTDILPVGYVNSNTLVLRLSDYNQDTITFKDYNRDSKSFNNKLGILDTKSIYLMKNLQFKAYVKTYHPGGALGMTGNKYDLTPQGVFYVNDYSIDEFGSSDITCLDGSKYLMDTLCPDILLEGYPASSVLRVLLDNVGFTNYNFNIKPSTITVEGNEVAGPDKSIPNINHWWTDDTSTVWQAIQDICRDIQMNAFVDEYGILQFYSRDYMYSQNAAAWTFRYDSFYDSETSTTRLPNIISFQKQEIASANQVKVLWSTPINSNYLGNSTYLWQSPSTFLTAGGLRQRIPAPSISIKSAVAADGKITYTADNYFVVGQKITVTGALPSQFNVTDQQITAVTPTTFTVTKAITGTYTTGTIATATIKPEDTALFVDVNTIDSYSNVQSVYNFAGYFLIDSEVIEFDAIKYQYTPLLLSNGATNDSDAEVTEVWISSPTDISKYRALAKNGYQDPNKPETAYFKPSGKYRIKTRGALGTTATYHTATSDTPASNWKPTTVAWGV